MSSDQYMGLPRSSWHMALFAGAILYAGAATAEVQSWTAEKAAAADAIVAQFVPDPAPSAVITISINGEPVFMRGFGTVGDGAPTEHTAYRVGSLTKQFTAAAVLTLVDRQVRVPATGRAFTLDTPVSDILTGVEAWGDLTVRDLLSHRSGLPNFTAEVPADLDPIAAVDAQTLLAAFERYPRNPERSFAYANTNCFLLAQIIEVVTGGGPGSFQDYVREFVLKPAGMAESGFIGQEPAGVALAPTNLTAPAKFGQGDWAKGAGNFITTGADIQRWNAAYFGGHVVLAASLAEALSAQTPTTEPVNGAYGFGAYIEPTADGMKFWHRGAIGGGASINSVIRRADGNWVSVTIMVNNNAASPKLYPAADALLALALE